MKDMMLMNKYKIIWSPQFNEELEMIYNYIYFKLKSPQVAINLYYKVKNEISKLDLFPERYSKVLISKNYENQNLRKMLVGEYVIIYKVDNSARKSFYLTYIPWKTKLF